MKPKRRSRQRSHYMHSGNHRSVGKFLNIIPHLLNLLVDCFIPSKKYIYKVDWKDFSEKRPAFIKASNSREAIEKAADLWQRKWHTYFMLCDDLNCKCVSAFVVKKLRPA